MSIEILKAECATCPRMSLPFRALEKSEEMQEVAGMLSERAGTADNMIEYQAEDGRFVTEREILVDQINGITQGAKALSQIASNAISECQDECPGYDPDLIVCQGNAQNDSLRMLEVDYGQGGLE